jgi:hypothetical protein
MSAHEAYQPFSLGAPVGPDFAAFAFRCQVLEPADVSTQFLNARSLVHWFHDVLNEGLDNQQAAHLFAKMSRLCGKNARMYAGNDLFLIKDAVCDALTQWIAQDLQPTQAMSAKTVSDFYHSFSLLQLRAVPEFQSVLERNILTCADDWDGWYASMVLAYYGELSLPTSPALFDVLAKNICDSVPATSLGGLLHIVEMLAPLDVVNGQDCAYRGYTPREVFEAVALALPDGDAASYKGMEILMLCRTAKWFHMDSRWGPIFDTPRRPDARENIAVLLNGLAQQGLQIERDNIPPTYAVHGIKMMCAHHGREAFLSLDSRTNFVQAQGESHRMLYPRGRYAFNCAAIAKDAPDTLFLRAPLSAEFQKAPGRLADCLRQGIESLPAGVWCLGVNDQWMPPLELRMWR